MVGLDGGARSSIASTSGSTRSTRSDDDGDVRGLPEVARRSRCRRRPTARRFRDVVSVSYGECESTMSQVHGLAHDRHAPARREAALGDHDRRRRRRQRVLRVRARRLGEQADVLDEKKPQVSWPASSPWVLAVGGTNLTLDADNTIVSTGRVERHRLPGAVHAATGGGGGSSTFEPALVAARPVVRELEQAHGARHLGVRGREPRLPDRLLERRPGLHRARARASPSSVARAPRRRSSPA